MAFKQTIAFEVDAATGNDGNGGGFDDTNGTPGTNYAWGAGQTTISYTDLTTAGVSAIVSSVARTFIAADVGNVIKITGGTNFTTGRYQILSVSGGSATLDRNCATGVGALGAGTLGGSLLTIQEGLNASFISSGAIADSRVYVKKGTYDITTGLTLNSSAVSKGKNRIIGYGSTHGDNPLPSSGNQPLVTVGNGAGIVALSHGSGGRNSETYFMAFDGTATGGTRGSTGISIPSAGGGVFFCYVKNFSSTSISAGVSGAVIGCEVTGSAGVGILGAVMCSYNYVHDGTASGIQLGGPATGDGAAIGNVVINNSGGSSDGIKSNGGGAVQCFIVGNTCYNNGGSGIHYSVSTFVGSLTIRNNICSSNGAYGINIGTGNLTLPEDFFTIDYNAYYNNTTAPTVGFNTSPHDVILSADPFTNAGSADFSLNTTTGGGAACRAAGYPMISGLTTSVGYPDIGTFQHQDTGGGGATQKSYTF